MTLSAAIVGAGRTGGWHTTWLSQNDDVRITGIADVRPEAAERLATPVGAATFTDYREMLERLRPDVVYLCTPATDHLEQITFAAELGVNLFIEKPLASTVEDAVAAADVIERTGVMSSVGYQWRYNPVTDAAREALGRDPIALFAGWWYWTIPVVNWIKDRRYGGGQVFDQATHLIDLMRFLGGDVTDVYAAYTRNAIPEDDLPNWDANAVTLRFQNGAVGSVHCSYALFPGIPNSNGLDVTARELLLRINLGQTTIFRRDQEPAIHTAPEGWNIDQAFIPAIVNNDPSLIRAPARESAKSVAVSLAANYSAETGKVVNLDDFMANPPTDATIYPTLAPVFEPAGQR